MPTCVHPVGCVSLGLALLCCFQLVRGNGHTRILKHTPSKLWALRGGGLKADKFDVFCVSVANPASMPQEGFASQNTFKTGGPAVQLMASVGLISRGLLQRQVQSSNTSSVAKSRCLAKALCKHRHRCR